MDTDTTLRLVAVIAAVAYALGVFFHQRREIARAELKAVQFHAQRDRAESSLAAALQRENAANVRAADLADALRAAARAEHARALAGSQDAPEARQDTPALNVAVLHLHQPAPLFTVRSPGCQN